MKRKNIYFEDFKAIKAYLRLHPALFPYPIQFYHQAIKIIEPLV